MKTLGIDLGSSFIKVSVYDAATRLITSRVSMPATEMAIDAKQTGWAEQSPGIWWENLRLAVREVIRRDSGTGSGVGAIGITYQMHGLVCLDRYGNPLRPSIIWCDSRAVANGKRLASKLGDDYCRKILLNAPGNFTASKLCWVKENEPAVFEKIFRILLPGDYIAYKLTGIMNTTVGGLSEGIFWDFPNHRIAGELLIKSGISGDLLAPITDHFGEQGRLLPEVARDLGLQPGTPVTYRAGDQPNNAFSLNVNNPGEVAATAGTSGVVYGISDLIPANPSNRVNTFSHVNHTRESNRLGVLLCINGTGILNSWIRNNMLPGMDYETMNEEALRVPAGSEGLLIVPFGNGAERMLENREPGCSMAGLNFNIHTRAHLLRAAQEGVAFAFRYGMEAIKEAGIELSVIRAGHANMFLSPVFQQVLANVSGVSIDLYETDGSAGAAMGAAIGAGYWSGTREAFRGLTKLKTIDPSHDSTSTFEAYSRWRSHLDRML